MAIAIPSYGTPGFVYNEDIYDGTGGGKFNEAGKWEKGDKSIPQEVVITCANKKGRVSGILNGGVKLNGQAQWEEMMGGGIMSLGGSLVETGNNLLQFVKGSSIQQPWMNRKMWKSTKPFSFDIPLSFVATTDPLNDVVRPCLALLSFCYPRELKYKDDNGNMQSVDSYQALKSAGLVDKNGGNSFGGSLTGTALQTLALYNIPGPGLRYGTQNATPQDQGDPVTVVVGRMFAFGACYLESVNVEFSQSMDYDGLPIAASVNVKATVMDAACCSYDGNFLIQEFYGSSEKLGAFLDKFQETASNLVDNMTNIVEKGIGFYKTAIGK